MDIKNARFQESMKLNGLMRLKINFMKQLIILVEIKDIRIL